VLAPCESPLSLKEKASNSSEFKAYLSEAEGTRTPNHRIDSPHGSNDKACDNNVLQHDENPVALPVALNAKIDDPELAEVVRQWARLPKAIKGAIAAMVAAMTSED